MSTFPPDEANRSSLEPVPDPEPEGPNVLEALQARRESHVAERYYDLEVPGMGGLLVLRMKPLSAKQLQVIADRAEKSKSPELGFVVNADTLIAATECVLGRRRREDELTVLPGPDGEPVRIGEDLAGMLKIEGAKTSREVVRGVFDRANAPDIAVGAAAAEYMEWASSANAEIDEELLGES